MQNYFLDNLLPINKYKAILRVRVRVYICCMWMVIFLIEWSMVVLDNWFDWKTQRISFFRKLSGICWSLNMWRLWFCSFWFSKKSTFYIFHLRTCRTKKKMLFFNQRNLHSLIKHNILWLFNFCSIVNHMRNEIVCMIRKFIS